MVFLEFFPLRTQSRYGFFRFVQAFLVRGVFLCSDPDATAYQYAYEHNTQDNHEHLVPFFGKERADDTWGIHVVGLGSERLEPGKL